MNNCFARLACAATALALFATAAQASVTYRFNIDSSSILGTQGFVEFQFNNSGGGGLVETGTAAISAFQNAGGSFTEADPYPLTDLPPFPNVSGHVSGILPGDVVLTAASDGAFNDYLHGIVFGSSISFLLTLDGQMIDTPSCAGGACILPLFALDFLNSDGSQFLLTGDPLGQTGLDWTVAQVLVDADGSTTLTTPPGPDGKSLATAALAAPVPEPATWTLMLMGLGAVGYAARRLRRT